MSKIRLRNNDVENISMISRLAKVVEDVPLNRLMNILSDDSYALQNRQDYAVTGLNALLAAFMSQRDQWPTLVAAECRLLNGKASSVRLMVKLLSLATDQEAPLDLNDYSDSDNDEEEVY